MTELESVLKENIRAFKKIKIFNLIQSSHTQLYVLA